MTALGEDNFEHQLLHSGEFLREILKKAGQGEDHEKLAKALIAIFTKNNQHNDLIRTCILQEFDLVDKDNIPFRASTIRSYILIDALSVDIDRYCELAVKILALVSVPGADVPAVVNKLIDLYCGDKMNLTGRAKHIFRFIIQECTSRSCSWEERSDKSDHSDGSDDSNFTRDPLLILNNLLYLSGVIARVSTKISSRKESERGPIMQALKLFNTMINTKVIRTRLYKGKLTPERAPEYYEHLKCVMLLFPQGESTEASGSRF